MAYNRKDSYYLKAKKEGYKSRAAYKIMELNQKYKLISSGAKVLDCGAAPGGWSQVALELVGAKGAVIAVDYAEITGIDAPNFTFICGDMTQESTLEQIFEAASGGIDVVLSDMAPKTTGIKVQDHVASIELAGIALMMAQKVLKPGGAFIVKLFDGEDREEYVSQVKKLFGNIKAIRPDSTRKASYELYLVATGFKGV